MENLSPTWHELEQQAKRFQSIHLRDLFANDPDRFKKFSLEVGDILLDYSKNLIDHEVFNLLMKLAVEAKVSEWRDKMFNGEVRIRLNSRNIIPFQWLTC